ncbi:unnamed protein product, partial [Closterium sp. Naga37s-1]
TTSSPMSHLLPLFPSLRHLLSNSLVLPLLQFSDSLPPLNPPSNTPSDLPSNPPPSLIFLQPSHPPTLCPSSQPSLQPSLQTSFQPSLQHSLQPSLPTSLLLVQEHGRIGVEGERGGGLGVDDEGGEKSR